VIADYYRILNLPRNASSRQIRKQTLALGTQSFPGRPEILDDPSTFISIVEAHEVLKDEKVRVSYDLLLDQQEGKDAVRERALEKHRLTIAAVIKRGKERGAYYAGRKPGEFREDHRALNWWSITGIVEALGNLLPG
jgi:DnaJ-class molecular chaperone